MPWSVRGSTAVVAVLSLVSLWAGWSATNPPVTPPNHTPTFADETPSYRRRSRSNDGREHGGRTAMQQQPRVQSRHNGGGNKDSSVAASTPRRRPRVAGLEHYIAPLRPVLTREGARLITAVFTEPFTIEVEGACRLPTEGEYNTNQWANACRQTSNAVGVNVGGEVGEWCTKFAAEFAIPAIIARSPWIGGDLESNVSLVEYHRRVQWGLGTERCLHELRQKRQSKPHREERLTFYTMMDDHGPCSIHGVPDEDWGALAPIRDSPLISVNGEKWSGNADTPCYHHGKDVVVPTPNLLMPSVEGMVLAAAAARAESSPRPTLAFMLRGITYTARDQLLRLWQWDDELDFVSEAPKHKVLQSMLTSKFCVQADGQAPWSPRLVEGLATGCVPVLVSDTLLPPFQRIFNWSALSVQVPQSRAADLKSILKESVRSGEYDRLRQNVLAAADAFRYYLNKPTAGAIPLVVAEMFAVVEQRAVRGTPYKHPWGWQPPQCIFLEDCPSGCDDERGHGREKAIPHPCSPHSFSDCYRMDAAKAGEQGLPIHRAWGAPPSSNVTVCPQKGKGFRWRRDAPPVAA